METLANKSQVYRKECFGVLDHYVAPASEMEVYVPMRVQPNGSGSEVIFHFILVAGHDG
jgi:hypothetical protein